MMREVTPHIPSPPIGRRPALPIDAPAACPARPAARTGAAAVRGATPAGAVRLIVGSQLLLVVQSSLVLASSADLAGLRRGIAAITGSSLLALGWALLGWCRAGSRRDAWSAAHCDGAAEEACELAAPCCACAAPGGGVLPPCPQAALFADTRDAKAARQALGRSAHVG